MFQYIAEKWTNQIAESFLYVFPELHISNLNSVLMDEFDVSLLKAEILTSIWDYMLKESSPGNLESWLFFLLPQLVPPHLVIHFDFNGLCSWWICVE